MDSAADRVHPARDHRVRLAAAAFVVLSAAPSRADLYVGLRNDVFTDLTPPIDDSGFTNDLDLKFYRPYRGYVLGGALFDRWITEVGGLRRWDQLDLLATVERAVLPETTLTVRLGPTFGGNLGGRWMQNGWHSISGTGNTLDQGLQDRYEGGHTIGVLAGVRMREAVRTSHLEAYAVADGQLALGQTGVTSFETSSGGTLFGSLRCTELGAHVEVAIMGFHVNDARLALPGGYGHGLQVSWRVGAHVAWSRYRIDYEYRTNEGGSGEPIGVVAFTIKKR